MSGYKIVKIYPHDRAAFTQGLVYLDGVFYEGTGLNGQSGIRKVRVENGEVLQQQPLDQKYFGEGIAVWKKSLIQLTWQSEIGFVYDLATFQRLKTFNYTGEGWGLTHDGTRLIMSDGSASLRLLDPETLREAGRLVVKDAGQPVARAERAGVREGGDPRQRLEDQPDRADLAAHRPGDRLDRPGGAARSARRGRRRRAERHRLRRGRRSPVRDRQTVAEAVRDPR